MKPLLVCFFLFSLSWRSCWQRSCSACSATARAPVTRSCCSSSAPCSAWPSSTGTSSCGSRAPSSGTAPLPRPPHSPTPRNSSKKLIFILRTFPGRAHKLFWFLIRGFPPLVDLKFSFCFCFFFWWSRSVLSQAKKKIPLLLPGFESIEMSEECSGPFSDMVNILLGFSREKSVGIFNQIELQWFHV